MKKYFGGRRYKLKEKIGRGSFGEISKCEDRTTRVEYACKTEQSDAEYPQLAREYKLYKLLEGEPHIPRAYCFGTEDGKNYLVMDLLGPSLNQHFKKRGRSLSIKTILMIGIQMISCVEVFHKHGYIHRDIKPDNFLTGTGKNQSTIYIIDYGLSRRYRRSSGEHVPYREDKSFAGTARYGSINALLGRQQSRRDDLESIGYICIYLFRGMLPWQNIQCSQRTVRHRKIAESKIRNTLDSLCSGMPSEIIKYMNTVRGYEFKETPDYAYLKDLFNSALSRLGERNDLCFDWLPKRRIKLIDTLDDDDIDTSSSSMEIAQPPPKPKQKRRHHHHRRYDDYYDESDRKDEFFRVVPVKKVESIRYPSRFKYEKKRSSDVSSSDDSIDYKSKPRKKVKSKDKEVPEKRKVKKMSIPPRFLR
jgi:serine/threonine protein kinase